MYVFTPCFDFLNPALKSSDSLTISYVCIADSRRDIFNHKENIQVGNGIRQSQNWPDLQIMMATVNSVGFAIIWVALEVQVT